MQQLEDIDAAARHIEDFVAPLTEMNGIPVIYKFEVPELQVGEKGSFNLQVADWIPAEFARFVLETQARVREESQEGTAGSLHDAAGPPIN